jgi:hypothetical protein
MTTNQGPSSFKRIVWFLLLFLVPLFFASPVPADSPEEHFPVPGLTDLRTTFSDGAHSPERFSSCDLRLENHSKRDSIPVKK